MKQLNTLLSTLATTVLLTSVFNVQAAEMVKAEPINQMELLQTVKTELSQNLNESKVNLLKQVIENNNLIVKQVNNAKAEKMTLAKISYLAD